MHEVWADPEKPVPPPSQVTIEKITDIYRYLSVLVLRYAAANKLSREDLILMMQTIHEKNRKLVMETKTRSSDGGVT